VLLFTPLSSTVYLVIYRSGQLEKTNNILNAKTHAAPASVPVIACRPLRVLSDQSLDHVRPIFTLFPSLSFSTGMKRHQCSFLFYCLWSASVLCLTCLVMLDLASLVLSKYFNGSTSSQCTTAQASLVYAAAFFLFLSPLLSLSSSSLVAVAVTGFPSHARVKPTAALDRAASPASREHTHVPSPFPSASVHRRGQARLCPTASPVRPTLDHDSHGCAAVRAREFLCPCAPLPPLQPWPCLGSAPCGVCGQSAAPRHYAVGPPRRRQRARSRVSPPAGAPSAPCALSEIEEAR